jgi:hypothetical protein
MSRTAEVYIDKSRKAAHDTFSVLAGLSVLLALLAFLLGKGGAFFVALMSFFLFGWIASKIKYTWRKTIETSGYELV